MVNLRYVDCRHDPKIPTYITKFEFVPKSDPSWFEDEGQRNKMDERAWMNINIYRLLGK